MRGRAILLSGLVWLAGSGSWAAVPEGPPGEPVAIPLGQRTGFTGAYPCSVRMDREGRTWVATDLGGLFVGDGLRFLKVDLPPDLAGQGIGGMEFDGLGRIWLLSTAGLARREHDTWTVDPTIRLDEISGVRRAEGVFRSRSGDLAVLASGAAFLVRNGGRPEPLKLPDPGRGDPGLTWRGGTLIANQGQQVWRREGQAWIGMPALPLQGTERIKGALRSDGAGHLYALTERRLFHLAPDQRAWDPLPYHPSPDGDRMTDLTDGGVWMLQGGQALRIHQGQITRLPLPKDLSMYGTEARCLDAEGNLWLASTSLMRLPAYGLLRVHSGLNGLPSNTVWKIVRDAKGRLWVSTEVGLYRQDPDGWHGTLETPSAHGLALGPDGAFYMRSQRKLRRVDPDSLKATQVLIPARVGANDVRRGPILHGNNLWVVDARGALLRGTWSNGAWAWIREEAPTIDPGRITYPLVDRGGRLWLLMSDRTYVQDRGRWEEVAALRGRNMIDLISPAADQAYAITYSPPTLLSLQRTAEGWTARVVLGPGQLHGVGTLYTVHREDGGAFWLNSDRGVVKYDPGYAPHFTRYGSELGLPAEDTNQDALLVEGRDRVWVGTAQGLAELRTGSGPELLPLTPPLVLEARCGDAHLSTAYPVLTVPYGRGAVVWELGFPGPVRGEGARFQFREAGGTWAELAGSALQFPEISPGSHVYEVRVMPFLGEPGPVRRLEMNVLPPWYRHPAAYIAWAGLLMGAIALGVRWRLARLQRRNRDLTEAVDCATEGLRARERDLEELNRRLYDLNETKNRVIGLAAHDLRNPLSGILLHAELLEEVPEPEVQQHAASTIRSLGEAMQDLIQRLLDVHAIEAGRAEAPALVPVDLHRQLARACLYAAPRAAQKNLTVSLEDGSGAWVLADEGQLRQILDNYLSNALKYVPQGTTITLRTREQEHAWRTEVQDEGPGLTADDLLRVFSEYARLSARPTAGEASVGLGLALVKRLAEGMGGRVGVESVASHGATFWLELPKAQS